MNRRHFFNTIAGLFLAPKLLRQAWVQMAADRRAIRDLGERIETLRALQEMLDSSRLSHAALLKAHREIVARNSALRVPRSAL